MRDVHVQVRDDFLERQSRVRKPLLAIAELIWNALDADATHVRVRIEENELGGLSAIEVEDDGHGMVYEDALKSFESLGGSWKSRTNRSRGRGRLLHGKAGRGRFRAFAVGSRVTWKTRYRENNDLVEYEVLGNSDRISTFRFEDRRPSSAKTTGTVVRIENVQKNFRSLYGDEAAEEVTRFFALYLLQYPEASITYDGRKIDPSAAIARKDEQTLEGIEVEEGRVVDAALTIIEWEMVVERSLYLCNEGGFALQEASFGIQAPRFQFTGYLSSAYLEELEEQGALAVEEMHPGLRAVLESARDACRDYFKSRKTERAREVVDEWKREQVYPFEGEPHGIIEETERHMFDVVALNLNEHLPDFERSDARSKRFSLRLLREAIEESPQAVQRIIQDVLELPKEKQQDLADLLERTTLAGIINASKMVSDRLDFLRGLEIILFHEEPRAELKERTQLHKILEAQTWIFGEEFALSVSDRSLTEVLRKHVELKRLGVLVDEPVLRTDDKRGIVDLMLSRRIPQSRDQDREHLVVELKRPSHVLAVADLNQIRDYATAVAEDERFRDTGTSWTFWLLGNDVRADARRQTRQRGRPAGLLHDDEELNLTVWVKSWGEILESCRGRLEFYRKELEYAADDEASLETLRKLHAKYLPPSLAPRA